MPSDKANERSWTCIARHMDAGSGMAGRQSCGSQYHMVVGSSGILT